jgi:hypothetical protein
MRIFIVLFSIFYFALLTNVTATSSKATSPELETPLDRMGEAYKYMSSSNSLRSDLETPYSIKPKFLCRKWAISYYDFEARLRDCDKESNFDERSYCFWENQKLTNDVLKEIHAECFIQRDK